MLLSARQVIDAATMSRIGNEVGFRDATERHLGQQIGAELVKRGGVKWGRIHQAGNAPSADPHMAEVSVFVFTQEEWQQALRDEFALGLRHGDRSRVAR